MIDIISKDSLNAKALKDKKMPKRSDMINMMVPQGASVSLDSDNEANFKSMKSSVSAVKQAKLPGDVFLKYGSAFDIPRACHSVVKNGTMAVMSVREMLTSGVFASGNTLPQDWEQLWDALRMDISVRKMARETVRQNLYNMIDMPGSSRLYKSTEFFPYATIFKKHNGQGQAVNQGEIRAGQVEKLEHFIYAAGFTWDLINELFNESMDPEKVSDSVLMGYGGLRDDLSISPILNHSYASEATTAAATGTFTRQEILHRTLENAVDEMGIRVDPITKRQIAMSDLKILASSFDSRHIARVVNGLPSPAANQNLSPITSISQIVEYEGEVIEGRVETTTYPGVTPGKAYLIKKNRYMNIGTKKNLTVEVDMKPDVKTLAREERSWYWAESQQITGIQYFIQEITLPSWPLT